MFPLVAILALAAFGGLLLARQASGQFTDAPGGPVANDQEAGNVDPSPVPADAPGDVPGASLLSLDPVFPDIPVNVLGFSVPTVKRWTPPATHAAAAAPYMERINQAESANDIPAGLLARVLFQESHFRPDIIDGRTRSAKGATGIAQFMPDTAAAFGVVSTDPTSAIAGAGRYLAALYQKFGSWSGAVAAYNWGEGNVARKGLAAAPAETRAYLAQIINDTGVA